MEAQALDLCRAGKKLNTFTQVLSFSRILKNCYFIKLSKSKFLYLKLYFTSTGPQFGASIVLKLPLFDK